MGGDQRIIQIRNRKAFADSIPDIEAGDGDVIVGRIELCIAKSRAVGGTRIAGFHRLARGLDAKVDRICARKYLSGQQCCDGQPAKMGLLHGALERIGASV